MSPTSSLPPPEHAIGYSVRELTPFFGISRTAMVRRLSQVRGVLDLGIHLPEPPVRRRKMLLRVPPDVLRDYVASLEVRPAPIVVRRRLTTSQKKRLERIANERSTVTRKLDKVKLAALRSGGLEAAHAVVLSQ